MGACKSTQERTKQKKVSLEMCVQAGKKDKIRKTINERKEEKKTKRILIFFSRNTCKGTKD